MSCTLHVYDVAITDLITANKALRRYKMSAADYVQHVSEYHQALALVVDEYADMVKELSNRGPEPSAVLTDRDYMFDIVQAIEIALRAADANLDLQAALRFY